MKFDASQADCWVLTEKDGLLSAVAHDLRLRVTRFSIDLDGEKIEAHFDPTSLEVETSLRDGKKEVEVAKRDRATIEGHIQRDVLEAARYPEIRFSGVAKDGHVEGELTLHGKTKRLRFPYDARGTAEVVLHQPDFGIRPFKAALGTLKVKADVTVRIRLPLPKSH